MRLCLAEQARVVMASSTPSARSAPPTSAAAAAAGHGITQLAALPGLVAWAGAATEVTGQARPQRMALRTRAAAVVARATQGTAPAAAALE